MPRLCSFGCEPSDATMHCFPNYNKFPERFKEWVILCGGKLEKQSDYEYYRKKKVCDKHFTEKDKNRFKRLNALAVPTLNLSGVRAHHHQHQNNTNIPEASNSQASTSQISGVTAHEIYSNVPETSNSQASTSQNSTTDIKSCETNPNTTETASPQASTSQVSMKGKSSGTGFAGVLHEHNYSCISKNRQQGAVKRPVTGPAFNSAQVIHMRTQIKRLRSEICRLRKKGEFQTRLANAKKLSESATFQQVVQRMAKPTQLFINMQMQTSKKPKGRRFTIEEKVLSLSLYKKSPKCYALLHKYFTLPSIKAMKCLLSKIVLRPGINPIIFEKIKKTISEKDTTDKLCSLAFDEMSLTAQINYDAKKDAFEGFASNKENQFADHALVFMVKGVKQPFKQPIAYYFTNCLKTTDLKKLIKTVIRHAQDSGLIILNTVCDQSSVNVRAINELVEETKATHLRRGIEWRYDCFSVNGRKIIPLFDTPHLIKGIRNNLITKDMTYTTKNKAKVVKWEYYQKVYAADKSYGELKLLHKLTEEHVNPEKIKKMRVKTATQLFSHSVAVVTEHLTARGDLPEECRQLVDITVLLNNLFDSLNVSSFNVPDGKIFKGAVKKNSPHHKLWVESKEILKTVKFIVKKKSTDNKVRLIEATVPSITNLIRTIEGMEAIWKVLHTKYGLDAMLTRNFNQDPVENFFGNIRSYGARNNAPNTIAFEGAFKALLLNNYSTPHSKGANCEEDSNKCLQNLDFFLTENCKSIDLEETSDIPKENVIHFNEDLCIVDGNEPQEDAGQRNYVCGWVLTKCLKHVCKSCQHCRKTILDTSTQEKNCNNSYIKAKEYKNKNWLCYPNKETENCFHEIQNITKSFLKKDVPKKNVKETITQFCDLFINYPFTCATHKEQLQKFFVKTTINLILYSWCRTINRILSGKIMYEGEEEVKNNAAIYYKKHKHYKNKK